MRDKTKALPSSNPFGHVKGENPYFIVKSVWNSKTREE